MKKRFIIASDVSPCVPTSSLWTKRRSAGRWPQMTGFDQRVGSDRIQASNSPCHTMIFAAAAVNYTTVELCHGGEKNRQFHHNAWCNSKRMEERDKPENHCSTNQVNHKTEQFDLFHTPNSLFTATRNERSIQFRKRFEDSVIWIETNKNWKIKTLTKTPLAILS